MTRKPAIRRTVPLQELPAEVRVKIRAVYRTLEDGRRADILNPDDALEVLLAAHLEIAGLRLRVRELEHIVASARHYARSAAAVLTEPDQELEKGPRP